MGDRRDRWSDLLYALTIIGLAVVWWRFVARLAYQFGVDYHGLSSGRRAAWQTLWLIVLYVAMNLLVIASGGHPFG